MGTLSKLSTQSLRRFGCKVPAIVVKNDMHRIGFSCQMVRPLSDLSEFVVGIVVIESLSHRFARQVRLGVSPMESQVRQPRIGDHVNRRHDGEMLPIRWRTVDAGERDALFLQETRGRLLVPLVEPVVMAQFKNHPAGVLSVAL